MIGFHTWLRQEVAAVVLAWAQYTCPHDDVETMPTYVEGVHRGGHRRCRKCGLVWMISTKGPA
jgi:hypothetical protein